MGTTKGAAGPDELGSCDARFNACDEHLDIPSATAREAEDPELLEFLAGDLEPVTSDPVFQQELGRLLWTIYRTEKASRARGA